jgi:glutathione S-transferase
MAIKVYSWPFSSGTRITWALEELGVPYEYIQLDGQAGDQLKPDYLAIHPNGKVPALVDGDQKYFEAVGILLHLAHKFAVDKGLWPAAGTPERAAALSWTIWSGTELSPHMMQYIYHGMDSKFSFAEKDRSAAAAGYHKSQLDRSLAGLERQLAGRDYITGASFTLADLAVAGAVNFAAMCGVSLADYPKVTAWCKRCTDRPARQRAK